jgi:hypothetical protein
MEKLTVLAGADLNLELILTLLGASHRKSLRGTGDTMDEEGEEDGEEVGEEEEEDLGTRARDALTCIKQARSNLALKIEKITNLVTTGSDSGLSILGNYRFYLEYLKCLKIIAEVIFAKFSIFIFPRATHAVPPSPFSPLPSLPPSLALSSPFPLVPR